MNKFNPVLYIDDKKEPYTILVDQSVYMGEDPNSLYQLIKTRWQPKTWLGTETRPYFLWTGCHGRIRQLDNFVPDDDLLHILKTQEIAFYLYEPFSIHRQTIPNKFPDHQHYDEFETEGNEQHFRSYELDSIDQFRKKFNIPNMIVYTCDQNVVEHYQRHYPKLPLRCKDIFIATDSIIDTPITNPYPNKQIHKKFWCGNFRYTGLRHLVMAYLAQTESFFSGNYSWYTLGSTWSIHDRLWFNLLGWKDTDPGLFDKIVTGSDILNDYLPLAMDHKDPPIFHLESTESKTPNYIGDSRLAYHYSECFMAIVNESRFAQPTANFSEKILHSIRSFRPFILFGPPLTLHYLHDLGFKTFGEFYDESYDDELNHEKRIKKIFKTIDAVDKWDIYRCRVVLQDMKPIFEHNIKVLEQLSMANVEFMQ